MKLRFVFNWLIEKYSVKSPSASHPLVISNLKKIEIEIKIVFLTLTLQLAIFAHLRNVY